MDSSIETLRVKRLSPDAKVPTRGSKLSAGYDLYSSKDITITKRSREVVPTDIAIAVPSSTYGRVAPRSGLAVKFGISTGAGVIDEDYRGPVGVVLFNHGDDDFKVKKGDRIAQLVIERIKTPEVFEVESLDETVRGSGGFGSTGGFSEN
ncbi:dUTP diphosphatase [Phakopsora pachyrhizi]|uniref:Deoxyuridine 5'-triphosphate nucleotidohydrolase n=1 Tax=Phakopsora pachyrhizi TaxID=170000 RepID=A0AAV0BLL9_PHAPC|nr:dUTP diphosphatase [Phakopsora pachyrhizi]CAH7687045.1 dUTP diphosphatase [Phakopsora pachyrhizi]